MNIDHVYVINLTSDLQDIANKLEGLPHGLPYHITRAVNGYTLGDSTNTIRWSQWPNWKIEADGWWGRDLKPGEVGCALSHINVWMDAINSGHENILVLEEDFDIHNWPSQAEWDALPADWSMVYLGRNANDASKDVQINEQVIKPWYSYTSHAYVINRKGLQSLLRQQYDINMVPVDEFLPAVAGVHARADMNQKFQDLTFNAYSFNLNYVGQTSTPATSMTEQYIELLDVSDWNAWLDKYISPSMRYGERELITDVLGPSIVEFPLFTERFCEELITLAETRGVWTEKRHEFYPTNDMLMEAIGMKDIYRRVIREFVAPLATWYWTLEGQGWDTVEDETFVIRYRADRQGHLSLHHDYSSYTIGVKLNDEFEGGGTYFPMYNINATPKRIGNAFMHPGMISHRHGGRPVFSGTRYIAVSFIKNTHFLK